MTTPAHDHPDLRARLRAARLYLVCDPRPGGRPLEEVVAAALAGGADIVQVRAKDVADEDVLRAVASVRGRCDAAGALLIVNDRPDLAVAAGADGVHVGQDDMPVAQARRVVGPERLVGLSTHTPDQVDGAAGADYIGVGPVHATPTKPGRPAVGLDLVRHAAVHARIPFFAIGGIDLSNVGEVLAAGARRIAVVRAIAEAQDPEAAARALRAAVEDVAPEARIGQA